MSNAKIRSYAQNKRVKFWQIAEKYGTGDTQFSKMLRHELPSKQTERIIKIIDEIVLERENGGNDNE